MATDRVTDSLAGRGLDLNAIQKDATKMLGACEWGDCSRDPIEHRCASCRGAAHLEALLAACRALREALAPFAIAAAEYEMENGGYVISDGLQIDGESEIEHPILWRDLRRAVGVLAQTQDPGQKTVGGDPSS